MKTTLGLALLLFMVYLAGCDFVGANEPAGDPAARERLELQDPTVRPDAEEPAIHYYYSGDTTGYE